MRRFMAMEPFLLYERVEMRRALVLILAVLLNVSAVVHADVPDPTELRAQQAAFLDPGSLCLDGETRDGACGACCLVAKGGVVAQALPADVWSANFASRPDPGVTFNLPLRAKHAPARGPPLPV